MTGFIIDLDGTIYRNYEAIDGAVEAIKLLRENNHPFVFLSNRGNISRKYCQQKLQGIGIECTLDQILLTSTVAAKFFRKRSYEKVWVLGDEGLKEELRHYNVSLANKPTEAEWLLISLHENVSYEDLNNAFRAVKSGAQIAATNEDLTFPREDGESIDVGGLIAAITATTKQPVSISFGKPSTYMRDAALEQLQLNPNECIVVGDSFKTDMALGANNKMQTALVLSGVTKLQDIGNYELKPTVIGETILEVTQKILEDEHG